MGRAPCCDKLGIKKGPWTPEEDKILGDYIQSNGHGSWRSLPKLAGLLRCGKSCRLRWTNYLRPDIKRGPFTAEEQKSIIQLHGIVGNKWSTIAAQLPGRTDNEIKNYWNTHLKKRLQRMGLDPDTYTSATAASAPAGVSSAGGGGGNRSSSSSSSFTAARHMAQWESARLEAEARLSRECLLFSSAAVATSGSAAASVANANASSAAAGVHSADVAVRPKPEPDYFLRMWNSEVGDAFRKHGDGAAADPSPYASSSKQSSAVAVEVEAPAQREEAESKSCITTGAGQVAATMTAAGMDDSSGSNEVAEDTSDETYQLYLNFAGDDLGLFNGQLGSFSSLFSGDLNEASLDTAFK